MVRRSLPPPVSVEPEPVFGIILFGGPLTGATVRDVNLANELSSRGYPVHVWWAMDRPKRSKLRREIGQHWLFSTARYWELGKAKSNYDLQDRVGQTLQWLAPDHYLSNFFQRRPKTLEHFMDGILRLVCNGIERDEGVLRRFASELEETGVTHMMPTIEVLNAWFLGARGLMKRPPRYLVTFQGYEVCANYARTLGCECRFYERLRELVKHSDWPAVAVSEDYRRRVIEDIGVPESSITAISVGVPPPLKIDRKEALGRIAGAFSGFRGDVPLITYLGRRDAEKGIDLLLYAASILRRRGMNFQVAVCGPTLHGGSYTRACHQIAENLRQGVLWSDYVSDELRAALFEVSHAVVYPSIHREAFGMVAVEAMAHGTPVIVPDFGGVVEAIQAEGRMGGLLFRSWDSGDLAEQMARVLEDPELRRSLSEVAPFVADYHSVPRMVDRLLAHMGLSSVPRAVRPGDDGRLRASTFPSD
jgi:glycosyltransferase involved in cell wall biosynthesis